MRRKRLESSIVSYIFDGDTLDVVMRDGRLWVCVASVCRSLGLSPEAQRRKLKTLGWARHAIMISLAENRRRCARFYLEVRSRTSACNVCHLCQ